MHVHEVVSKLYAEGGVPRFYRGPMIIIVILVVIIVMIIQMIVILIVIIVIQH